ncbi:probable steroid-binding protein 3 [Glycine soja]|nr:probable steroid-binding protein 3 [Glycine max]XP_028184864.1 probable steroid-binding protein 3 [Glycine soja]|eukprot:XP_003516335.1 probable steroid-binding protein 3 [Glycine max]
MSLKAFLLPRHGCQLCGESEKQRVTGKVKWFDDQKGGGHVYDVSIEKSFYSLGGPYAMFAGKDASRALAKMSKNDDDISPSLDDLSDKEIDILNDWENKFQAKYPVVARVLN